MTTMTSPCYRRSNEQHVQMVLSSQHWEPSQLWRLRNGVPPPMQLRRLVHAAPLDAAPDHLFCSFVIAFHRLFKTPPASGPMCASVAAAHGRLATSALFGDASIPDALSHDHRLSGLWGFWLREALLLGDIARRSILKLQHAFSILFRSCSCLCL